MSSAQNTLSASTSTSASRRIVLILGFTCIASALLCSQARAQRLEGRASGLQPTRVFCTNLTTGQRVVSSTTTSQWDCVELGLSFAIGDQAETGFLGTAPGQPQAANLILGNTLPDDFELRELSPAGSLRVLPGDLDGDGDIDVMGQDRFSWYENLGGSEPTFVRHLLDGLLDVSASIGSGFLQDIDQDGRLDILGSFAVEPGTVGLAWFRNEGGTPLAFSRVDVFIETSWDVSSPKGADIDGDGDTDIIASRKQITDCEDGEVCPGEIVWIESDGASWIKHTIADTRGNLAAVDFDSDGDLDIATSTGADDLLWYENQAAQFPVSHLIESNIRVQDLEAADIDDDGDQDLLVVSKPFAVVASWYENTGAGTPTGHEILAFDSLSFVGSGDVSGDGRLDVIFVSRDDRDAVWLENIAGNPPTFIEHDFRVEGFDRDISKHAADFDSDGRLDLVMTGFGAAEWYRNQIGPRVTVTGLRVRKVICRNRTTRREIQVSTGALESDCEALGLEVNPGDQVEIIVRGLTRQLP